MTYEPDKSPEEWGEAMAEALWAVLTPWETRMVRRDIERGGREEVRRHIDRNLRDDMVDREEYVEATVDAYMDELGDE